MTATNTHTPTLSVITRVPIPARVDPKAVLASLHAYEPLIKANPYVAHFEQRHLDVSEVVDDPLFLESGTKLQAFIVVDRVPVIPGFGAWGTKEVGIPCVMQSFDHGVRVRANAQAGVVVRSSYEVRRRGEVQDGPDLLLGPGDEGEWELVEIAGIDCNFFVKHFVRSRFSSAHQEILQRVVDGVARKTDAAAAGVNSDPAVANAGMPAEALPVVSSPFPAPTTL
ncbi:hypothetical protein QC761_0049110 [Podospora bellae-mahoneyi]|uniref:DUF7053 domain-containing protein n=1 Tax=Podospora bellae-mahoneyi TaxID=2093777 RepID=A0ABR0FM35_9PEZI|nr:hypothetical protein QC761_0049110 [Podospora bellae-mahoneyi]